jgi:hypothetical protein
MAGVEIIVPVAFFATTAVTVLGIAKIRSQRSAAQGSVGFDVVEKRLARVEVALDDLAAELARVTEGQQFLTQVLTDRKDAGALPGAPRASSGSTPH